MVEKNVLVTMGVFHSSKSFETFETVRNRKSEPLSENCGNCRVRKFRVNNFYVWACVQYSFLGILWKQSSIFTGYLFAYLKYTAFFLSYFQNVTEISENTRLSVVGFNQVTLKASGHVRLNFLFLFSALVFYYCWNRVPI